MTRLKKTVAKLERWMTDSHHGIPLYVVPQFLRIVRDAASRQDDKEKKYDHDQEQVSDVMEKVKVGLRDECWS